MITGITPEIISIPSEISSIPPVITEISHEITSMQSDISSIPPVITGFPTEITPTMKSAMPSISTRVSGMPPTMMSGMFSSMTVVMPPSTMSGKPSGNVSVMLTAISQECPYANPARKYLVAQRTCKDPTRSWRYLQCCHPYNSPFLPRPLPCWPPLAVRTPASTGGICTFTALPREASL